MSDRRAIGVFDSGLGGLTVAREIIKQLPFEDIVYFGDTGRVPYGTRSCETIKKYAAEDERFLLKHDVKLIVAACGTVSSVAADTAADLPVPFFEVVTHAAKAAVSATKNKKIGVIGTSATIGSGQHKKHILSLLPEAEVTTCSCSMFVPLVEEGWYSDTDTVVVETVKRYLEPIIASGADTLILGCTHYPVLSRAISSVVGEGVTLINAGTAVASAVSGYISGNGMKSDSNDTGAHRFYVTDKPGSFRRIASTLLGEAIDDSKVKQVDLSSL